MVQFAFVFQTTPAHLNTDQLTSPYGDQSNNLIVIRTFNSQKNYINFTHVNIARDMVISLHLFILLNVLTYTSTSSIQHIYTHLLHCTNTVHIKMNLSNLLHKIFKYFLVMNINFSSPFLTFYLCHVEHSPVCLPILHVWHQLQGNSLSKVFVSSRVRQWDIASIMQLCL